MTGFRVRSEIELWMSFHFNLGFCLEHRPPRQRRALMQQVAGSLGRQLPERSWTLRDAPPLPGTLAEGGVSLHAAEGGVSRVQTPVDAALKAAGLSGIRLCAPVQEELTYFDHGGGSLDLCLRFEVAGVESIPDLFAAGMAACDALRAQPDALWVSRDWDRIHDAFLRAIDETGALHDMWGILGRGGQAPGLGKTVVFSFVLRSASEGEAALHLDEADLPRLLAPLTGLDPAETVNRLAGARGVPWLFEGWNGQVALISDPAGEAWLRWLWAHAFHGWATLSAMDHFLYEEIQKLGRSGPVTAAEARAMMSAMRRIEQSAAVLGHLCQPDNVWDDANQRALHQGIFDSWATERLLAGVKEKLDFLGARSAQLAELLSGFFQDRMNVIMTVFTFVTFAGVMADVISAVDFQGALATEPLRLSLIVSGTLSVLLLGTLMAFIWQRRGIADTDPPRPRPPAAG